MPTIAAEMDRRQKLYSLLMPVMNLYVQLPLKNLVFIDYFVSFKKYEKIHAYQKLKKLVFMILSQVCAWFRQRKGIVLLVHQSRGKNPKWVGSSTRFNKLLQKPTVQNPTF